jgi:hypothetical protein
MTSYYYIIMKKTKRFILHVYYMVTVVRLTTYYLLIILLLTFGLRLILSLNFSLCYPFASEEEERMCHTIYNVTTTTSGKYSDIADAYKRGEIPTPVYRSVFTEDLPTYPNSDTPYNQLPRTPLCFKYESRNACRNTSERR